MIHAFQNFKALLIVLFMVCYCTKSYAKHSCSPFHNHSPESVYCDLCGCATSSGSFGFGTLSQSNFIGLRYTYQSYTSKLGIFDNSPTSKEQFNTYQLWAQIPVYKKFYATANIPFQDLNRTSNTTTTQLKGLGDAQLMGWYKWVFYKKTDSTTVFTTEKTPSGHSIQFGLGAKLPTGAFEQRIDNTINPGFQLGTGSLDGIFTLGYTYASNTIGVNSLLSYYAKGNNKNKYQFGNQFSYSVNVFTAIKQPKYNIMPFIGLSGDVYQSIKQYNETINETSGSILNSTIGSELAIKNVIFGANYTMPLRQHLFGDSVIAKSRFSVYVNYAL